MDRLTINKRSALMARVRGKDTCPEMRVRRLAYAMGMRFRLHRADLPGKPDLVFPKYKTVVFVHGCFWHRHRGCRKASRPKLDVEFWQQKFEQNVERDKRNIANSKTKDGGWSRSGNVKQSCRTLQSEFRRHYTN